MHHDVQSVHQARRARTERWVEALKQAGLMVGLGLLLNIFMLTASQVLQSFTWQGVASGLCLLAAIAVTVRLAPQLGQFVPRYTFVATTVMAVGIAAVWSVGPELGLAGLTPLPVGMAVVAVLAAAYLVYHRPGRGTS